MSAAAKAVILFYQATLAHFIGGNCRYYPSCSNYASEAFESHSFWSALCLTSKRLLSCHPLAKKQFYDPVPTREVPIE